MKGEATRQNIQKQKLKAQKLYQRLDNISTGYINKVISDLVKTKPMWITIEGLNECGYTEDRDYNASLNLRDCQAYSIA